MHRQRFAEWLERYVDAWKSYDPSAIGALFAENASYRYHPWDEPLQGRDAIVASWLESADQAGTYDARYVPLLIDGDTGAATGWSRYFSADGGLEREYRNLFVCHFDSDGRCRDFTEWFMLNREVGSSPDGHAEARVEPETQPVP